MEHETKFKLRVAAGGTLVASVAVGAVFIIGEVSQLEAYDLLKTTLPTTRFFCSAVLTGTATILALMVTLVSLSSSAAVELKAQHYRRIQRIAMLDAIAFAGAMALLLFIMIPMEEAEVLPLGWYRIIYYVVLGAAAVLGALVVSVMMMLYSQTRQLIRAIGLEQSSPLVKEEDGESEADDESG